MANRWEIRLDESACMSSGLCTGIAPEHFLPTDAGPTVVHAMVIEPNRSVADAAACCPAEAITVRDADTGQPIT